MIEGESEAKPTCPLARAARCPSARGRDHRRHGRRRQPAWVSRQHHRRHTRLAASALDGGSSSRPTGWRLTLPSSRCWRAGLRQPPAGGAGMIPDRAPYLWIFVSVLVVAALALSFGDAGGAHRRHRRPRADGRPRTRGHAIEALARAEHFVFDKTGTLTYGEMPRDAPLPRRRQPRQRCLPRRALEQGSARHRQALRSGGRWRACRHSDAVTTTRPGRHRWLGASNIASAARLCRRPRGGAGPPRCSTTERSGRTVIAQPHPPAGSAASCSATGCGKTVSTFDVLRAQGCAPRSSAATRPPRSKAMGAASAPATRWSGMTEGKRRPASVAEGRRGDRDGRRWGE